MLKTKSAHKPPCYLQAVWAQGVPRCIRELSTVWTSQPIAHIHPSNTYQTQAVSVCRTLLCCSYDSKCLDPATQHPHQRSEHTYHKSRYGQPSISTVLLLNAKSLCCFTKQGCVCMQEPLVVSEDSECLHQSTNRPPTAFVCM